MFLEFLIWFIVLFAMFYSNTLKRMVRSLTTGKPLSNAQLITKNEGKTPFILLASLGNPEKSYKGTRHSVGHLILKEIAERQGFESQVKYGGKASFYQNPNRPEMLLYESTSLMNISGKNVKAAWTDILNSSKAVQYTPVLVVLHDELDMKLGKVKVKKQMSSHKGHNGLRSLQNTIGGGFIAISIGISRPESRAPNEVADYVLSRFPSSELQVLRSQVVPRVEAILEEMIQDEKYIYEVNESHSKTKKNNTKN